MLSSINSFFGTQLNGFKHRYLKLTIQFKHTLEESFKNNISTLTTLFNITYSFVHNLLQVLLCITNNSVKRQSFVYTQLNGQTVLFDP